MKRLPLLLLLACAGGAHALQLHLLPPRSTDVQLWREAGYTVRARGQLWLAVGDDDRIPPQLAFPLELPEGTQPFVRHLHAGDEEALPQPLPGGATLILRADEMQLYAADPTRLQELEPLHLIPLSPPSRLRREPGGLRIRADKAADPATKLAIVDAVDANAIESYLTELINDVGDRNTFRVGDELAADHLEATLQGLGYTVQRQHFIQQDPHEVDNIIAIKPGTTAPDEIVVVGAHYDATSFRDNNDGPALGAEDNGSGTASVLHLAEIFANYETERTIHFVLFGMEEQGLYGSKHYVSQALGNGDDVVCALIMDMMAAWTLNRQMTIEGWKDAFGYPGSQELMDLVSSNATGFVPTLTKIQDSPGWGSDHEPFADEQIPALLLIETDYAMYSGYHRTTDTLANASIHFDFAEDVLRAMAATLVDMTTPSSVAVALSGLRVEQREREVHLHWHAALSGNEELSLLRDGIEVARIPAEDGWMEYVDRLDEAADGELLRYELRGQDASLQATLRFRASTMLSLAQNQPNPFHAASGTGISLTLGRNAQVDLSIYDVAGRRVRQLYRGAMAAGLRQLHWDGRDDRSETVAAGIYFYRLRADDRLLTKRLTVLP